MQALTRGLRVLQVCYSDSAGGAARAAMRLHTALRAEGVTSQMLVGHKGTDDDATRAYTGVDHLALRVRRRLALEILKLQRSPCSTYRSVNLLPSHLARRINASEADVVNLHWIGWETLSIGDVGRIRKPIVWTLHDMWPFCGTEHYVPDGAAARFRAGYAPHNREAGATGCDLDARTWRFKRRAWTTPMHVVSPSTWLANCARESALMGAWPVETIPNPLNLTLYRPTPRAVARRTLGIPPDAKIALFGAVGGTGDRRKGFHHLIASARILAREQSDTTVMIFGGGDAAYESIGCRFIPLGPVTDEARLALIYSAADVFVAPSEMDNLPNTVAESLACGTPVVAFDIGGLPDLVTTGAEGYLARALDAADLAAGILWVLRHPDTDSLRSAARSKAERMLAQGSIVARYRDVYERAVARYGARRA